MSGGFSFPPPPPPPPTTYSSQNGSTGYIPAESGRGRGRGRGRGEFRGDLSNRSRGSERNRDTHAHPGFDRSPNGQSNGQSRPHTGSSNATTGQHLGQQQRYGPVASSNFYSLGQSGSPSRTIAGHKRKLDAILGSSAHKPSTPGLQTVPATPSFGAPILPSMFAAQSGTAKILSQQKPNSRGLGLVPSYDVHGDGSESGEEDHDADEEAMYVELGDKLTFEHNGVVMSLNSQADLLAWTKERQKNWPTDGRIRQKYEEKQRIGEERRRLLAAAAVQQPVSAAGSRRPESDVQHSSGANESKLTSTPAGIPDAGASTVTAPQVSKPNDHAQKLAELRRKVAESEARNRAAKAESQAIEQPGESALHSKPATAARQSASAEPIVRKPLSASEYTQAAEDNAAPSDAESVDSSSESSSDSTSEVSSDSDSDGSAPEVLPIKPNMSTQSQDVAPLCRYFEASGRCVHGDTCRFRHEWRPHHKTLSAAAQEQKRIKAEKRREAEMNKVGGRRKTIMQRLVEQEEVEHDKLALQVIKHLGKAGFFSGDAAA